MRVSLFLGLVLLATPASLIAQAAPPKAFAAGDIFIDSNGDTLQVTQCKGAGWQMECKVRRLAESGKAPIDPSDRWWSIDTLRGSERSWIMNGGAPYSGPRVALPGAAATPPAGAKPAAPAASATTPTPPPPTAAGVCPKTPYGGPVPGTRPASAALFRQKISDSITMGAYGVYWYGVAFDSFSVGTPIRNVVSNVPGIGATRVTNGAPPNATLHPVTTTMRVCEGAPSGSSAWRVSQKKYFCFVSKDQEWTCGATN